MEFNHSYTFAAYMTRPSEGHSRQASQGQFCPHKLHPSTYSSFSLRLDLATCSQRYSLSILKYFGSHSCFRRLLSCRRQICRDSDDSMKATEHYLQSDNLVSCQKLPCCCWWITLASKRIQGQFLARQNDLSMHSSMTLEVNGRFCQGCPS